MIYIGIDPGKSGGIAMLDESGSVLCAIKMPESERDLLDVFCDGFIHGALDGQTARPCRAMLERVSSSPQMGRASAFTFGFGYGALTMALTAARIPYDRVVPRKWRQALGCATSSGKMGERNNTEAKNITKRRAQELFPQQTVIHATADSLLLAEYCRRVAQGVTR